MLTGTSHLEDKLDMIDILEGDASTEIVSIGRPLPLTICDLIKTMCGIRAQRVSQTLKYRNGPLRINVHQILSRKRRKHRDWGETVDVSLNIRYALCSRGRGGQITTPEQLLTALEEIYGTRERDDTMVTANS